MPRRWMLLAQGLLAAALCLGLLEAGLRAGASVLKARRERRSLEALQKKGDYRILCAIDDSSATVVIVKIGHRRDVYR